MFTIDPKITDPKIRERNLYKVLFSMNVHQVATPELSVEEARSYVFFLRSGAQAEVYIGLYFINTDRRLYYTHSSNPFPEEKTVAIEAEARGFAEDLGAMLDEIDFTKLTSGEKSAWFEDQEILSGKKKGPESVLEADCVPEGESLQPSTQDQPFAQTEQPPAGAAAPQVPAIEPPPQPASVSPRQAQAPAPTPAAFAPAKPVQSQRTAQTIKTDSEAGQISQAKTEIPSFEAEPAAVQRVEKAVKAEGAKTPNVQLKKDMRSASGVISKGKEALARLMASF